jgi:hypothetical protein
MQGDCEKAAQAIVDDLTGLGFKAEARKTPGRPMVVAHYTPEGCRPEHAALPVLRAL